MVMVRFPVLLLAVIACQSGRLSAETGEWGKAVDGLQMSVALVSESGHAPELRITVRNVSDQTLLLPVGQMIGSKFWTWKVAVFASTSQGQFKFFLNPSWTVTGGRVDPIAIPMVPHISYTIQMPVTGFFRGDGTVREMELPGLIGQAGQLWVEWESGPPPQPSSTAPGTPAAKSNLRMHLANCPLYGAPNPNMVPCWESKMVSNTLQLAQ
jgi:hypothetical protein